MNTVWVKIAGIAVVIVVVVVVLGRFRSSESGSDSSPTASEQNDEPKTFYDMAERDKQLVEPMQPDQSEVADTQETTAATPATPPPAAQAADQPPSGVVLPSSITKATTLHFKPLDEIEDIEAQRLMPVVGAGRSIGRLPITQYGLMVQGCRQVLQRWPDSSYAFQAKRMLEEIAERYARNYKITPEEMDISRFLKPRQGTQPYTVEPIR